MSVQFILVSCCILNQHIVNEHIKNSPFFFFKVENTGMCPRVKEVFVLKSRYKCLKCFNKYYNSKSILIATQ